MLNVSRDILIGFLLLCTASWWVMGARHLRAVDQVVYDSQVGWLRTNAPARLTQDVVVIGIDEAAYEAIPEPTVLWHSHFGTLLTGLSTAQPSVVGLAMPLPVRSYHFLVKDIDFALIAGINRMRDVVPLVVGQPPGIGGKLRPIAPAILSAVGEESIASIAICEDTDGVVRRLNQTRCRTTDKRPPLAFAMAKHLGRQGSESGLIDFSVGGPIEYTPIGTVLDWIRQGQEAKLQALVKGRAVVIANLLPSETRYRLPVQALAGWEPGSRTEPSAVVHIQALRSLLARGLIETVADRLPLSLTDWKNLADGKMRLPSPLPILLATIATLFWFGRTNWLKTLLLAGFIGGLLAGTTFMLWHGTYLRIANVGGIALLAFLSRQAWDYARSFREQKFLRTMFAGHVSPQVMKAILGGELQLAENGQRSAVTLFVVGIRGFGARSAKDTPEATMALLNRFHAAATQAIQNHGGAVDKAIGDGLLATFGLPQPLPAPPRNALEAAQDLLLRIDRLNTELAAEGIEPLKIGIGIHCGEVLSGYVGYGQRSDFSVIGEAISIASRLEILSKDYPHSVICSHEVAAAVGFAGGLADLGTPVADLPQVWGWTPPLTAPISQVIGQGTGK